VGNVLTRYALRIMVGHPVSDTQTGLRGLPLGMLPRLVELRSNGYEFELDMLVSAKHHARAIEEVPIQTIYLEDNRSSHFDPLRDSVKIWFQLLRFALVSLATAAIDNAAFGLVYTAGEDLLRAQVIGRAAGMSFQYLASRRAVFLSGERHAVTLPRYLAVVTGSGAISYAAVSALSSRGLLPVLPAKLLVETLLFLVSFYVLRDFVFTRPSTRR
jgi:putative flippase GtrA